MNPLPDDDSGGGLDGLLAELLGGMSVKGGGADPADDAAEEGALNMLQQWVRAGKIELTDDADLDALASGLNAALDVGGEPGDIVNAIIDMPGVEEIYLSDEEIEQIAEAW